MTYRTLLIGPVLVLLTACMSSAPNRMNHNGMMMDRDDSMMHAEEESDGFLPWQGDDVASLPEAKQTETISIEDGDTITLNPTMVRTNVKGKEMAMYGYNGQIPGPLLRVPQGSTFTVRVTNNIDMPTAVHWHGIRLDNASDGAVGVTQSDIAPGRSYTYTVTVPDEGLYWYHSHLREDVQQPMGLYGGILVTSNKGHAYAPVNKQQVLIFNDLLLDEQSAPVPFGRSTPDRALMGRFGNVMFTNGQTAYAMDTARGETVRFFLLNAANTRTFNLSFGGAKMKLVGGDNGRYEKEQFVDSVILSPSERAIVDVFFSKPGTYTIEHRSPDASYELGTVTVDVGAISPSHVQEFNTLGVHADVTKDIDAFRSAFKKDPDHTLILDIAMMGGMNHGMMMGVPAGGIEWEDAAMNTMPMASMMQWKMADEETGAWNEKLTYTAKVGDVLKIRIVNKADSMHPMQHPIHFHGQRFLVLSDNGVETDNFVWKDTVLVRAGHTVDLLLDVSNPGDWMFHCHIAEHLGSGMMGMLTVQ